MVLDRETALRKPDEWMTGVSTAAVIGHVRPDGDCVGSCLGLRAYLLAAYGIEADVYLEAFPDSFRILPGAQDVNPSRPADYHYDLLFALDCSEWERAGAGRERAAFSDRLICIDHHQSNPGFGDDCVLYPGYSSCCEVLYSLMREEKMNRDTAICLYLGMVHDTGVFQYSSVTPETMARAGKLISFGFDFPRLITSTYYEKSYSRQQLTGLALQKSRITPDGNGIWTSLSLKEMEDCRSSSMETDGIAEALRITKGIDYAILLYQTDETGFKGSFRSKGGTDVGKLAACFGGGGHKLASGCSFEETDPERIMERVNAAMLELNKGSAV